MKETLKLRRRQLMAYMQENGFDAVLITVPTNIYYLTGFYCNPHERFLALYVNASTGEETLFVPLLDQSAAQQSSSVQHIIPISDTEDPYHILKKSTNGSMKVLGIEKNAVTVATAEHLMNAFPTMHLQDIETFILSLRVKKSRDEIDKVRAAVEMIENVVAHAVKHAVVGMTELELTAELEYQMKKLGASRPAFESIVLTGLRTALPHGKPEHYPIQPGDFLLIDIGVQTQGYCSDITRTFVMGEETKVQREIYDTVLAANRAAIEVARAGIPLSALDDAARQVISDKGFGPLFTHRVGHGFGMDVHEKPSISGQNGSMIEPGLLFTIEPGIYDPAIGGVRIEDDVYINEDGTAEVLTSYPKELIRLGV